MRDPILHALQQKLPFLPGYQFQLDKDRPNERKSHSLDYCNGVPVAKAVPGIGGKPLPGQESSKIHTSVELYPHSEDAGDAVPAWVAFDRKVLRFYAYFQEAVHERREEQFRVRKVNIYFYLEDDSVHVSEPKTANSGIPQGTLIRRHRIPKPDSEIGQHYTVAYFNVGKEVTFYAKTFKIVGCDKFTRDFLQTLHITVPSNALFPYDPYTAHRNELASRMKPTRPRPPQTSLKKFLENDRRVLRFYCIWDDTQSVFGDLRHMIVHYYLSDDTIEIREHIPANSGRDTNTLFLRRNKLPKRVPASVYGYDEKEKEGEGDYFNERDFMIGSVLHLYGRPFVVCDCDEFTKEYYYEKYGVENFDPVRIEDYDDAGQQKSTLSIFPPMDTTTNYELLLPPTPLTPKDPRSQTIPPGSIPLIGSTNPPKKDFSKQMLYDNVVLRFSAILKSTKQVDKDRKFVVSLYVADDGISVFEPKMRNTGLVGGKFLEKGRIRRPDGVGYYEAKDFFVGAEMVFFHHPFILTSADDYAIKFMNAHPEMFPLHKSTATETSIEKPPTPGPTLHKWQEEILEQGKPLPMTQPEQEFKSITVVHPSGADGTGFGGMVAAQREAVVGSGRTSPTYNANEILDRLRHANVGTATSIPVGAQVPTSIGQTHRTSSTYNSNEMLNQLRNANVGTATSIPAGTQVPTSIVQTDRTSSTYSSSDMLNQLRNANVGTTTFAPTTGPIQVHSGRTSPTYDPLTVLDRFQHADTGATDVHPQVINTVQTAPQDRIDSARPRSVERFEYIRPAPVASVRTAEAAEPAKPVPARQVTFQDQQTGYRRVQEKDLPMLPKKVTVGGVGK